VSPRPHVTSEFTLLFRFGPTCQSLRLWSPTTRCTAPPVAKPETDGMQRYSRGERGGSWRSPSSCCMRGCLKSMVCVPRCDRCPDGTGQHAFHWTTAVGEAAFAVLAPLGKCLNTGPGNSEFKICRDGAYARQDCAVFDLSGASAFGRGLRIGNWQVRPACSRLCLCCLQLNTARRSVHVCIPYSWFVCGCTQAPRVLHLLLLPSPPVPRSLTKVCQRSSASAARG
jgi:hypothetical protein